MRPATRILYTEAIANPTTAVADLRRLADIAHETGALLVVDSTLAPPVICRPLEHGADLVLHSATKYIGGHSDVTGGVVTGPIELVSQLRATRIDTGGSLSPDDAFLLRRAARAGRARGPFLHGGAGRDRAFVSHHHDAGCGCGARHRARACP